ncbi:MAG: type VI secretion system baseplate subunit TssE [Pseudomonadales bacterium]|nr:type VI secretion system baseplate subunit TssE [Pseudomonadales bacterium]
MTTGSRERLQPALLDRLRDDEPEHSVEARNKRVITLKKLQEYVTRDLNWLLNTTALSISDDLSSYPEVQNSVLNYGANSFSGISASSIEPHILERQLKKSIIAYEPRILAKTLDVQVVEQDNMNRNAIVFHISGELWAEPLPIALYIKTEIDLETGEVNLS